MEETPSPTPSARKKIRLTKSEVYAMEIASPRKKRIAFGLVALLIALALGNLLWHFQDWWLPFWLPRSADVPAESSSANYAPMPGTAPSAADAAEVSAPVSLEFRLDYLSAALWDHPQFLQGVKAFNAALDQYRLFLRDETDFSRLRRAEAGTLQAAQAFTAIQIEAPASIPLGDYIRRCQMLLDQVRRLGHSGGPSAPPAPSALPARSAAPAPRPGEAWQEPEYLQGAKLFNAALEQYKLFIADKSRTELLKPIEEAAFQAAKKFEALKGLAPTNVPIGDHITQCYKLIADCRRQTLELKPPDADGPSGRGSAGPSHRPALPAYQPPQ